MPKYVYDPRLNMMVPQQKRGIDYALTGEGLRITDHDKKVEFVITRNDECRLPGRGMKFDCKLYDTYTARQIAGRVQRIYPQSKYKDWRFFAKGFHDPYDFDIEEQMTSEDKALLRSLTESYGTEDVMNFVNHLDEGHVASVWNAQSSHGQTPGTTQHGLKGFVNALPSLIVGFLVCPPAMILGWLGAVHERTEKRWLKTRINPNRWLDFVATPWEKQKKVKDKIAEEMAANTNYYYTRLANGEILRVVGCSTLEAKEMVMAVEKKDIIPRYVEWDEKLKLTDGKTDNINPRSKEDGGKDFIMWVIKFDNGEACYAFGNPDASDKDEIKEAAIESRKAIVEYYKKIKYEDFDQKELGASNPQTRKQKHGGIGKENKIFGKEDDAEMQKLFAIPKIDDMIRIDSPTTYKIINDNNFKEFTVPQTSPLSWGPSGNISYRIKIENFATINLPLKSDEEVNTFLKALTNSNSKFSEEIRNLSNNPNMDASSVKLYKEVTGNKDVFILPAEVVNGKESFNSTATIIKKLTDSIAVCILDNPLQNETPISEFSKKEYRTAYQRENEVHSWDSHGTIIDDSGNLAIYTSHWPEHITYEKIDSKTNEILAGPIAFKGTEDTGITNKTNPVNLFTKKNNNAFSKSPDASANITQEQPYRQASGQ